MSDGEHPVARFRRRLAELQRYPPGVVPVPSYLSGTAFFSGAAGLVVTDPAEPLPPFPYGGVMFVGHNLDSEAAFLSRLGTGQPHGGPERPMRTWRNLYRLLRAADLEASECFFTNAFVGLKAGAQATGRYPGAHDPEFRAWCQRFLEEQISVTRPSVIATLGTDARRFVAAMSPDLVGWRAGRNSEPTVVATKLADVHVATVPLRHPSGYHASLARARYRDFTGIEAEAGLLTDAVALAVGFHHRIGR